MTKTIFSEAFNKSVVSADNVIVLLHGFPMNHKVWTNFASDLSSHYTVITPDLPGFGKSAILPGDFSLSDVAEKLNGWVKQQGFKPILIGHSMGGYVALEMVRQDPSLFQGLGLFHSTSLEDNEDRKASRTKVLQFVDEHGVIAFTSNFIQPLFADQNHPAIPFVKDISMESSAEAVKGYTRAMRDRRDNSDVLSSSNINVLLIGGDKDKGIPIETLRAQASAGNRIKLIELSDCGHMGMFEKREQTLTAIQSFASEIFQDRRA